jgi:hypothetical protein
MATTAAGVLHSASIPCLCRLITTYANLGRVQAPPIPSLPLPAPPLADIPEEDDDLHFEDDSDAREAAEEAEVEAEEEAEAKEDDDDLAFLDDLPDSEEKAAEHRALLTSFESVKKGDDVARARVGPRGAAPPCARALRPAGIDRGGGPPLVRGGAAVPPRECGGTPSSFHTHPEGAARGDSNGSAEEGGRRR